MTRTVDFCHDYASPNACLAWTRLPRICAAHGAELNCRPFVIGAVFEANGHSPPAPVPARGRHMLSDLARWADHRGVPLNRTPHFPVDTVNLMKGAAGVALRTPERSEDCNATCFSAIWVDGRGMGDAEAAAIVALTEDDEVRARLGAGSGEAVIRGAFGAPTMHLGDEMFFGQDRPHMPERALAA